MSALINRRVKLVGLMAFKNHSAPVGTVISQKDDGRLCVLLEPSHGSHTIFVHDRHVNVIDDGDSATKSDEQDSARGDACEGGGNAISVARASVVVIDTACGLALMTHRISDITASRVLVPVNTCNLIVLLSLQSWSGLLASAHKSLA